MIEKCNFKVEAYDRETTAAVCSLAHIGEIKKECVGEENCILYMAYFLLNKVDFQTDPIAQKQLYNDLKVKKLLEKIKKRKERKK